MAGGIGYFSATGLFRKFQRAMRTDEVCGRPLDSFALPSGCGLGFGENFYAAVLFGILYAALFRIPHSDFRISNCFFTLLVLK